MRLPYMPTGGQCRHIFRTWSLWVWETSQFGPLEDGTIDQLPLVGMAQLVDCWSKRRPKLVPIGSADLPAYSIVRF